MPQHLNKNSIQTIASLLPNQSSKIAHHRKYIACKKPTPLPIPLFPPFDVFFTCSLLPSFFQVDGITVKSEDVSDISRLTHNLQK